MQTESLSYPNVADGPLGLSKPSTLGKVLAYRTRDAAAALGVSERTLQALVASGEIPHVRIGRAVLFPVRELADWLTARTTGGNASSHAQPSGSLIGTEAKASHANVRSSDEIGGQR